MEPPSNLAIHLSGGGARAAYQVGLLHLDRLMDLGEADAEAHADEIAVGFYHLGGAELSYFVLPADGLALPEATCPDRLARCATARGYSVVAWERAGLVHAVVGGDADLALALAGDARERSAVEPPRARPNGRNP